MRGPIPLLRLTSLLSLVVGVLAVIVAAGAALVVIENLLLKP
jgi:hypothetical protein